MIKYTRSFMLLLMDALLINVAFVASLILRFDRFIIPENFINIYIRSFIIITIIQIVIYYLLGLYKSLWQNASMDELLQIFKATVLGTAAALAFGLMFRMMLPRSVYIIAWLSTFLLIGGSRMSFRLLHGFKKSAVRERTNEIRVMVIGAGDAGSMVIKELKNHRILNCVPVAVIDDDKWKQHSQIHGIPVVGDRSQIIETANKLEIDEIILAIPSAPFKEYTEILNLCKETKCKLKTLPGVVEAIDERIGIRDIRDVSIEDLLGRDEVQFNTNEVADYLRDEVVLVTGGGGSIGSELCRQIARFGPKKLIIYDIYENNAYDLQNELLHTFKDKVQLEVVIGSVRDMKRLLQVFEQYRPGIVYHAAAHKHVPLMEGNPGEAIKNNVIGTLNTARCADKYGTKKFVLISTDKAVNPTNIMGATKRMAEMIVLSLDKNSQTEFVAVRFGNVLGSNGSVIPLFKKQIAQGGPVTITHPDIIRYFMTIPEAARLVMQAGAMAKGGEVFILDMGEPVKILDLAMDLIRLSGLEPGVDIDIEFTGLRPGEKLYEELLLEEEGLKQTQNKKIFIGKPLDLSFDEVLLRIKALENCMDSSQNLRECMARVVPTYQYKNQQEAVGMK